MFDREFLETLPHGEDRLNYYKKCIAEADNEKNVREMLWLRHDYIQESVFHDDSFKGMVMFPEFMKLFDEHPGEMSPRSFMFPFKWILENSEDYYQIPVEQIDSFFERFKEYINKFGYTMRTYYYKKYQTYQDIDLEKALAAFDEMDKYERTEISDCEACEGNGKARKEMRYGSPEKAVSMLNDMLDRNMRCTEVPQCTYATFAYEFARRGMYGEAEHYAGLFLPMIKGNEVNYINQLGDIIAIKSITDPNGAYELFCRCAGMFGRLKNPRYRFDFAKGAYRFFARLAEMGENEIPMRLSADFDFHRPDGRYDSADLRDKFYAIAKDLAEKFDKRNGTSALSEELDFVFPDAPIKELTLPVHGSFTPDSPVLGIVFTSAEEIPQPDRFEQIFGETLGLTEMTYGMDEEHHAIFVSGKEPDGSAVRYRLAMTDAPDREAFQPAHWFPEGALEDTGEYAAMLVINSMIPDTDRFAELRKLLKLAETLAEKSSAPFIYDLMNNRIISRQWLKAEAKGETNPFRVYYSRIWLYRSAFAEDKYDILTTGMSVFGSREFLVPAVAEEDVDFARNVLNSVANAASLSPLPDEGVALNSGIVYDNRSFVYFTWKPIHMPVPDHADEDEEIEIFAEPIVFLTAADREAGRGMKITEIPEEEREKLSPRTSARLTNTEEAKCRERFPDVLEYFRTHDCGVIIGSYCPPPDDETDEDDCWFHAELIRDNDSGGITGKVLDVSAEIAENLHEGDTVVIDPESVFFTRIDITANEEPDSYFVDEFYIIFDNDLFDNKTEA